MRPILLFITIFLLLSCDLEAEKKEEVEVVNELSASELLSQISSAVSGDTIYLEDGKYTNLVLDVDKSGIIIEARNTGKVYIEGESQIELSGDNITLKGVYFRNGYPVDKPGAIYVTGSNNHVTECTIDGFNDSNRDIDFKWLSLGNGTTNNEVSYCTFTGKNSMGTLLVVWRDSDMENNHHIHHNLFSDVSYNETDATEGSNGFETIRIGTGTYSQSDSNTIVEYNYFEECNGEIEIISNKSGGNIYRYNTFIDSKGALTLRQGHGCTVDSNYFDGGNNSGTSGVRVTGEDHIITNNYFIDLAGSGATRGAISITHTDGTDYREVKNVTISNNTIIGSKQSFIYGGGADEDDPDTAPYSVTISDNLVINDNSYDIINIKSSSSGPLDIQFPTYSGNIYYGTSLGLSPIPDGIDFSSTVRPDLTQLSTGQYIHSSDNPIGAEEIIKLSTSDVGVGNSN